MMTEPSLNILMIASEAAPYAKTGGLADVTGALPPALRAIGHQVVLVLPWYPSVVNVTGRLSRARRPLLVPFGGQMARVGYRTSERDGVRLLFVDVPEYFNRPQLYGERGVDYPDNARRFGLLSRAALELARHIGFAPDVIHAHDWQTGLVPVYLREHLWADPFFAGTGSLFTIHNLGYRGDFPAAILREMGLDSRLNTMDGLEFHGRISLLKGGIQFADRVSTVSPTYCREIQTPVQGMGLDGLLRSRADHLHGILNGIDMEVWNPGTDQALAAPYSAGQPAGKAVCKQALQRELGLPESPSAPLLAMITRLDPQKGIETLLESLDRILERGVQLVVLGTGQPDYEQRLAAAAAFYPDQARVLLKFDDALSRRIYAASDLFLMPSRYEPCGLGQLIALRYGSLPLVHATGGLIDTIRDLEQDRQTANGFVFTDLTPQALLDGLDRALQAYRLQDNWQTLRQRAMAEDFSWKKATRDYVNLYRNCARATP